MKTLLKQLSLGDRITDYFVCAVKNLRIDKNGNKFLQLRLTDAGGNIGAVMWDVSDSVAESFAQGDVVKVQGTVTTDHRGQPQIKLERIRAAGADDDFDLASLLPASARPLAEMQTELAEIRENVKDPDLRSLLDEIFADPAVYQAFCDSPAAKGFHHNYIHGLLEHSVSVCRVAGAIAAEYTHDINSDLLITGAILHDIGKTIEFEYKALINYSDSGRLLGHIILGEKMVSEAINRVEGFPPALGLQLLHLIISHHGEYEYGSPRRPKTLEAFVLHHADDIDAKANVFQRLRAETEGTGASWSEYNRVLERFLYLKKPGD